MPLTDDSALGFVPNLVNLAVIAGHSIVPRPFAPIWDAKDIFILDAQPKLGNADGIVNDKFVSDYVDDWDKYHRESGETHCGTNERRIPNDVEMNWWNHWKD